MVTHVYRGYSKRRRRNTLMRRFRRRLRNLNSHEVRVAILLLVVIPIFTVLFLHTG